jgi:hypothetical protein
MSHDNIIINNSLKVDSINPKSITNNELVLHHNKITIPTELYVSSIKPLEGGLTNQISILGNKITIGSNTSDIYLYGKIHFMNSNGDQDFFNEVDGFLNQAGI